MLPLCGTRDALLHKGSITKKETQLDPMYLLWPLDMKKAEWTQLFEYFDGYVEGASIEYVFFSLCTNMCEVCAKQPTLWYNKNTAKLRKEKSWVVLRFPSYFKGFCSKRPTRSSQRTWKIASTLLFHIWWPQKTLPPILFLFGHCTSNQQVPVPCLHSPNEEYDLWFNNYMATL